MRIPVRGTGVLLVFLCAALTAVTDAASEPLPSPLPAGPAEGAAPESGPSHGTADERAGTDEAREHPGAGEHPGTGEHPGPPPRSRLLRSLSERPAQAARPPPLGTGIAEDVAAGAASGAADAILDGCPRALLAALLAEAAETGDAVSALAIEREVLGLCRERQEIVTGIVTLEANLRALLEEMRPKHAGTADAPAAPAAAELPITVKESPPVRVVTRLAPLPERTQVEVPAKADPPTSRTWSWFSIIGTAGDLRAGVSDGARTWFVREGDRLPGGVTIGRIAGRPPGAHVGGEAQAALPYRPRPGAAMPAGAGP